VGTTSGLLAKLDRAAADLIGTDADRVRAYAADPNGFARAVLGIALWDGQIRIVEASRDHLRVAVVSGHKVGKSTALAVLALWFYCSFPGARVIITATTARQVDGIIWREVRRLVKRSKLPIPGAANIHDLARSGLKDPDDFSEIVGFTAREAEAVAGISGEHLLYLVDEASGVPDLIFEAIEGNRAGGEVRIVLISNPTRSEGEFFEAFHSKRDLYSTLEISSEDTPNASGRGTPIPGLASREWIEEKAREWGRESPLFKVRVLGKFVVAEEAKVIPLALIAEAQMRWHAAVPEGRLFIGLDCAGDSGEGDETVAAVRRARKLLGLRAARGLNEEGHLAMVLDVIAEFKPTTTELPPIVCLDYEGPIGTTIAGVLEAFLMTQPSNAQPFQVMRIRPSDRALRQPFIYDRMRDELWANMRDWLRDDGALLEDAKLERELHCPSFFRDIRGRTKVTPKREMRKLLGRSPDRADACALACWVPLIAAEGAPRRYEGTAIDSRYEGAIDPYSGGSNGFE
jgi:hypothetical protein